MSHFLFSALRSSHSVFLLPCCLNCIYSTSTASGLWLLPHTLYSADTENGTSGHSCKGRRKLLLKQGNAAYQHYSLERKSLVNGNKSVWLHTHQQCVHSLHTSTLSCRISSLAKVPADVHLLMQLQITILKE